MKIAVLEFICSSGNFCAPTKDSSKRESSSLLGEGFAMLHALGSDLIASGIQVHSILDSSIVGWAACQGVNLDSWEIKSVSHDAKRSAEKTASLWLECARDCDATIVIAPELDGTLATLIDSLRASGIAVLASDQQFLETASDKWLTNLRFQTAGVRHPDTWLLSDWLLAPPKHEPALGWVVKRRDSAGAVDLRQFSGWERVKEYARHPSTRWHDPKRWIVQPWLAGQPASIGVLAGANHCHVLGAFEQHFGTPNSAGSGLAYCGGSGPLQNAPLARLKPFVERAIASLPGKPAGWIGIDFLVEPDDQWTVIEINPRVTSSYLGYRQLYGHQLALALLRGEAPHKELASSTTCCFSVGDFHG